MHKRLGLKVGDVITAIEGKKVKTMEELNAVKNTKKIGDKIELEIYRTGEGKKISIILGEKP